VPRLLLAAGLAVAVLLGASLALVAWSTRPDSAARTAAPAEAPSPAEPPAAAPAPGPAVAAPAPASAPVTPPPPRAVTPPRPRASPPAPPDRHALRDFRRELGAGLAGLEQQLAPCALGDASFTLALETVEGGLRIADARLAPGAPASPAGVICARGALVGHVIPAPSARPGRRWEMPFSPRGAS
jgi:hypothetical protein